MPMPNRLLPRASHIDRIQRQRDFNELLGGNYCILSCHSLIRFVLPKLIYRDGTGVAWRIR